ncbi:MAG: ABC transporter substrate-binding protein, partial [Bacteroidales bacterium]
KFPEIHIFFRLLIVMAILSACTENRDNKQENSGGTLSEYSPEIATGFRIEDFDGYRVLYISDPWNENAAGEKFYLVNDTAGGYDFLDGQVLEIPVTRMVCLSATHLSFLDALDAIDRLVGVSSADYVVSDEFRHLHEEGRIREIGIGDHFKLEELIRLSPQMMMVSPQEGQGFELLRQAGFTIVPNGDYLEPHPLGRAEWIKMVGVLTAKEQEAAQIFDSIKTSYNRLKGLSENVSYRPTVLSGKQYGGFWALPGGNSYLARFIADAGARYLWAENSDRGSLTMDFEAVYHKGIQADFWRFVVFSDEPFTYSILLAEDARYADFEAVKNKKVLVCNTRKTPYFQKGLLEPQVILADYISIFHPDLLPDHQPTYYRLLP